MHEFSAKELEIAKRRLIQRDFTIVHTIQRRPMAILLGGQPASGKTKLFERVRSDFSRKEFVEINGDEYRQYHPRAAEISEVYGQDAPKYTQAFSNALVEHVKTVCLQFRYNFIIEGTMRNYDVIERTSLEAKGAGFRCEAHALAIHRQDSLLGIFLRYERDKQRTGVGRFSPIEVHDEAYRQIPLNLNRATHEKLFDRIAIYTRQGDGQLQTGFDTATAEPAPVDFSAQFEQLRQPIFSQSFYHDQWIALSYLARHRGETNEAYLRQITEFVGLFQQ